MKRVAVINDLSGLGRCSLTAALPVLSVMGVQPCALPTAVLTNQTGYPSFSVQPFTPSMSDYVTEWKRAGMSFDAIYTGFMIGEDQVCAVGDFLAAFKTAENFLLVDPIMGDDGARYPGFSLSLCDRITELALTADVITPNLTEACLLTHTDYEALVRTKTSAQLLERIAEMGRILCEKGVSTVVITGIHAEDRLINLVVDRGTVYEVSTPKIGGSYSGTGDLLASALCGGLLRGESPQAATKTATHFLSAALADAVLAQTDRNDGVPFESHLSLLLPKK